jgi:hypothetical protein
MSAPAYSKPGLPRRRVRHECRQEQLAHYAASSFVADVRGVRIALAMLGKPSDGLGQEVGGDLRIGERAQPSQCGTATEEGGQPIGVRPLAIVDRPLIQLGIGPFGGVASGTASARSTSWSIAWRAASSSGASLLSTYR